MVVLPDVAGVYDAEPFLQRDRRLWRHSEVLQSHFANLPVRGLHVDEAHAGAVAVDLGAAAGVVGDEDDAKIYPLRLLVCHLSSRLTIPTGTAKEAFLGKWQWSFDTWRLFLIVRQKNKTNISFNLH